jgi:hypothetical protein
MEHQRLLNALISLGLSQTDASLHLPAAKVLRSKKNRRNDETTKKLQ